MTGKAPYAALHLPAHSGTPDLFELLKAAGKALLQHDNGSGRPLRISRRRMALMGDRLGLCLTHFKQKGEQRPRIVLRVLSRDGGIAQGARAIALLLEAVRSLSTLSGATEIEWLSPRTRLAPEALPEQSQRAPRKRLAPIDAAEERALSEGIRAAMAASIAPEPEATRPAPRIASAEAKIPALVAPNGPVARILSMLSGTRGGDLRTAPQ